MTDALIVAHGQPSDPEPAEAALAAFAARVSAQADGLDIGSATLAAKGSFEAALGRLRTDGVVYPLFMAKGWFVTDALPGRMAGHAARLLDPLGTDPGLPALAADALRAASTAKGWRVEDTEYLLAAHGSGRSRNPARVALDFAEEVRAILGVGDIGVGFVEEAPTIEDMARPMGSQAICLPVFARPGGHASEDVPQALDAAGFAGLRLPVLGELPEIPSLIAQRLTEAVGPQAQPAAIR
ncbi:Sirohydrochlorin ferrochelatase [Cribrihabitans marinus]|uniref:Sirohydrochlorin ferrochelatase n=1 Tax=Cribrihabitans marinus TaxID=1227549 RepID=A0A1H6TXW0_9RHOB|nr:CbiX/SirB N-terminal domain-containing protein [Cribrihabitans marinus]GGH21270.1 hypothetical protein GCM10010973_05760 [Cribrihabitans marinus]SEI84036.1 Sirohydrochlorin ferrochelatase [Cribrihabitans marinus]